MIQLFHDSTATGTFLRSTYSFTVWHRGTEMNMKFHCLFSYSFGSYCLWKSISRSVMLPIDWGQSLKPVEYHSVWPLSNSTQAIVQWARQRWLTSFKDLETEMNLNLHCRHFLPLRICAARYLVCSIDVCRKLVLVQEDKLRWENSWHTYFPVQISLLRSQSTKWLQSDIYTAIGMLHRNHPNFRFL